MTTPLQMDATKGQGLVFLNFRAMPACLEALKMTDTQGMLQENGTCEALREYLLLPDTYAVLGVFLDRLCGMWSIIVESAELPQCEEGMVMPEVVLKYQRHTDGTNSLLKIDVQENRFT